MIDQTSKSKCEQCGKKHFGQCLIGSGKCFGCGEVGHHRSACPLEKKSNMLQEYHGQAQQMKLEGNNKLDKSQFSEKQSVQVKGEMSDNNIIRPMKGVFATTPQEDKEFVEVVTDITVNKKGLNGLEQARKEFAEFEEKVKRSVLLFNLSPEVTTAVLKMALEQFGNVVNVEFIPNLTIPCDMPQCALVEMEDAEKARKVIKTMKDFPFMISGMPRPVSAHPAKAEMFSDRPAKPGRKINFRWVDKSKPDFEVGERVKKLCSRHVKESLALTQLQLEEEDKLAKQQEDMVMSNYKKHEMIELLLMDGIAAKLAHRYGIDLSED